MSAHQTIYIARHGYTVANAAEVVQGFDDPLNEIGHAQAKRLAERAAQITFTHLLASDMTRAHETARHIADRTQHPIILEPLLREVWRPLEIQGLHHHTAAYQSYLAEERENYANPNWRLGDGENFADIQARAVAALDQLAKFAPEPIFVVSHGHFIRALVATVLMRGALTPNVWESMSRVIVTHNTGITILRYHLDTQEWRLVTVNDHAHFADD